MSSALCRFAQSSMQLQVLLSLPGCVSDGGPASLLYSPSSFPCFVGFFVFPRLERRPELVELWWLLRSWSWRSSFSAACGFFGGPICFFVALDSGVRGDPSNLDG
ncbi:hypothetical protein TOPH_03809 [Tolypocladium ophioglossoides CBS 100239]|uniref:Uncharacterized protein n=1 Tax=Tolypocladium ophioglossoides (strain CBS 100239) TaxID=1163406 RepID=A0A0L0NCV5_TOLOC|nr:hypothetical protein TOPH_03809 [Tolypocladium ophioglossoides CBS 100239]